MTVMSIDGESSRGRAVKRIAMMVAVVTMGMVGGACSVLPRQDAEEVVESALARIAAHDLGAAAPLVCAERRHAMDIPVPLGGIFAPVGAMPGFDIPRTLAVIQLDVSRLAVSERSRDGSTAEIAIDGTLVERFEAAGVEALFRAYAAEAGQPLEQELLDQTLANVSNGPVEIEIHETVPVIFEDSAWRICPPAPTP